MTTIITVTNTKGGVGKTTLTANLAGWLADQGQRVLAVDADSQPTLSSWYPLRQQAPHGLHHLITQADGVDAISHTAVPNLDLVYSDDPQGTLQQFILHAADGRQRLDYTLRQLREAYDVILIDTQGAVGPLQESAIFAGDLCLSPIRPDQVSAGEFHRGSLRLVTEQRVLGSRIGVRVGPLVGLLYGIERTRDARNYVEALTTLLRTEAEQSLVLLRTRVPATVAYKVGASRREPVHRIDRVSRGKTPCAAEVMKALAREILALACAPSMVPQS